MIKVEIKHQEDYIVLMKVSGHALFDDFGKDIVCAGVSSVMVGLLNALDLKTDYLVEIHEDDQSMMVSTQQPNATGQMICEVGLIQLQTIANQFPKNIKIREVK